MGQSSVSVFILCCMWIQTAKGQGSLIVVFYEYCFVAIRGKLSVHTKKSNIGVQRGFWWKWNLFDCGFFSQGPRFSINMHLSLTLGIANHTS